MDSFFPMLDDPKRLLLDLALQHSVEEVLRLIVERLSGAEPVALARIWLAEPTTDCSDCPALEHCQSQTECLHLVASGGRSIVSPEADWTKIDGDFRRMPVGLRKVGTIAATGIAIEEPEFSVPLPDWIARPDWVQSEGIQGFAGQPLIHRGKVLGVLAVFVRQPIATECMGWLRMIADHAAAAIATARAFAEIGSLREQLEQENEYLREELKGAGAFGEMIGQSPALEAVSRQIDLVAPTDAAVLILGESGTGKELVAREIHRRSQRADRPLIKVNCAAIPRELYESEFFGHAKGSFTGALRDRVGRFELAEGGTLFLDEVGEIPLELQAKLLRVLQEGELERVGEERTRHVNVRIIAATNRDLRAESEAARFRQDLYYRLSVFPVEVPALRRRKEDIPLLADHFLEISARRIGRPKSALTLAAVQRLQQYDWPGNVRELQHVMERAVITSTGSRLNIELPDKLRTVRAVATTEDGFVRTDAQIRQLEKDNITAALRAAGGKVSGTGGAAELLGLKPTTLTSRIKKLEIDASLIK
ncbi:sigma 54-interacting transcriptional regulator [Blastopirellula sp. JC732]|uniref:Sigma 54-interacting transcriptional regulator n=1 Tax=Blastopirellula sediminis TaxID=2894196 RepID=A0A9X1MPK3_9BACT|nr:sigma 54-interacting transcriptional regulator [Blastopirellula sediminis]MCC9606125.1 sigma 54-interacting transcriptional regulator [Blastopirellula sediminis]MCC9630576.1 sigma 54-interacting transcriptional regulator [Blastopirellula sediminis]